MTVVCALRLNSNDVLVAADTLYSTNGRASKYENKIFKIGDYIVSFSGDLSVRDPIIKEMRARIGEVPRDDALEATNETREPKDLDDFLESMKTVYAGYRERFFTEGPLRQEGGYTFEDFRQGKIPPEKKGHLESHYRDMDTFEGIFLVIGKNKRTGTQEIHRLHFPGTTRDMGYYAVVGPRKSLESVEAATKEVESRTTNIHSLDGHEIGLVHGIRTVLDSVQKGWPERGVGGRTQLVMRTEDTLTEFDYTHTTFMHNLLELERRGDFEPSYISDCIDMVSKAARKEAKFDDVVDGAVAKLLGLPGADRTKLGKLMAETVWLGDQFQH